MKRALLFLALAVAGLTGLILAAGGVAGPKATRPEPRVEATAEQAGPERGLSLDEFAVPGVLIKAAHKMGSTHLWDPLDWVDPITGTKVRLVSLRKWWFHAEDFEPLDGKEGASGRFRFVRIRTYRLPNTLAEAQAAATGDAGAIEALVKLRVTADEARAEFLSRRFSLGEPASTARTGPIHLVGKVHIDDVEQGLSIDGSDVTIDPEAQSATGEGLFTVRHAAYRIQGRGLTLRHEENPEAAILRDRVELIRDVQMFLSGNMDGSTGLALDLGSAEECPCEVQGPGGAIVTRETTRTVERLHLRMKTRMRAQQEGGRSIEADRLDLIAYRPANTSSATSPGSATPGTMAAPTTDLRSAGAGWRLERFEADGNVIANYKGTTDRGDAFLASMTGRRLVHEVVEGRTPVTIVEGNPDIRVIGRLPLDGMDEGDGTLRLSCRDQAWVGPAPATDIPPGGDPANYRRVILRGAARIERSEDSAAAHRDLIEGEEISLLLLTRRRVPPTGSASPSSPSPSPGPTPSMPEGGSKHETLAVSFAASGDVRIGGTRMSGSADRLVVTGLDTEEPFLVADGRTTSFSFTDLAHAGGPFGMGASPVANAGGSQGAAGDEGGSRSTWLLDRLQARGGVDCTSSFGGASVGLATHLQGDSIAYDRISDLARLSAGPASPARVQVLGLDGSVRDLVEAGRIEVERSRGIVRLGGGVFGSIRPDDAGAMGGGALDALARGTPEAVGITTEGAIEVRMRRRGMGTEPAEGAEQLLRVTGPLKVELRATNGSVDRLRADSLELVMVHAPRAASAMLAPVAARPAPRSGSRGPTRPASRKAPAAAAFAKPSSPWQIRCSDLTLTMDGNEIRSFDASGAVSVEGDDGTVRGDVLTYDAATRRLSVRMRGAGRATAVWGPAELRNRVVAPELVVTLAEATGLSEVLARGPVHALLYREDAKRPGRYERFDVRCDGDVQVTDERVVANTWVEVRNDVRDGATGAWPAAGAGGWTLWTERLVVTGRKILTGTSPEMLQLEAAGPKTAFVSGSAKDRTSIWGDRFLIDMPTSQLTVTGAPDRMVQLRRGPENGAQTAAEYTNVVIDFARGTLVSWDNPRLVLPRSD